MRILFLTPPMTQLNAPYPATAYLVGFLRERGRDCAQVDVAIELIQRLFSAQGMDRIAMRVAQKRSRSPVLLWFGRELARIRAVIEPTLRFLQGRDPSVAYRIVTRGFLPEGAHFSALDEMGDSEQDPLHQAFGTLGVHDRARYLASLFLDDLADVIRAGVDDRFAFVRYAESLADSAPSFDPMAAALASPPSLIDTLIDEITGEILEHHAPDVVGITVPFVGNVYGAFRIAQSIRRRNPEIRLVLGGGYVNTELRSLREPRVFDYFDFITVDDGEQPLLCLLEHLDGKRHRSQLFRTFVLEDSEVQFIEGLGERDVPFAQTGTPTWEGLPLDRYLGVLEMLNPMHRLWSDTRWNKLTVAHGCYWKKCSFCDVTLDYIRRYDPASAVCIVDRIDAIIAETGQTGFHCVDEAAPPSGLRGVAEELLRRHRVISWWGNIRFEKAFTPELVGLLADSGCIAVTGGLEVASDRLLRLMNKGVTIEQVARVTRAFSDVGIMVHADLMYGFPTQTVQETVDALEVVRQLFAAGCIQSGFWHRFAATVHSPVGRDPAAFGVELPPRPEVMFAQNGIPFQDPSGVDHDRLGDGLNRALYNYMHGIGLENDVREWFDGEVPATTMPPERIERAVAALSEALAD